MQETLDKAKIGVFYERTRTKTRPAAMIHLQFLSFNFQPFYSVTLGLRVHKAHRTGLH